MYRGSVVDLGIEALRLPDGRELRLEVVRHSGGAAVVAVDETLRVCMLRQYRHAAGGWLWELPAGKIDPGERPAVTAARELEEEAGLRASRWATLGEILTTPGFCDEVIYLYLATGLNTVPSRPGRHELLEARWLGLEQAVEWALQGKVRDAKTVVGLMRARFRLRSGGG